MAVVHIGKKSEKIQDFVNFVEKKYLVINGNKLVVNKIFKETKMKTKLMMIVIMMMVLAGVSVYAGGFDYRGVWIVDTVDGYMNINSPKNRVHIEPSYYSVMLRNEKGKVLTNNGSVHIKDQDHIEVTDTNGKRIKLVSEDYAIYARALEKKKKKNIAKFAGGIALEIALCSVLGKVVKYGIAALFAL